eukprot:5386445-Amphidinium_carterae.1
MDAGEILRGKVPLLPSQHFIAGGLPGQVGSNEYDAWLNVPISVAQRTSDIPIYMMAATIQSQHKLLRTSIFGFRIM